jgi:DNA-binding HxlR family transcriptional regulator
VRKDHRSECVMNRMVEMFGDQWSLLVIRDIMFMNRRHFRELLTDSQERIASNILADRLQKLVKLGIIVKSHDPSHKQKVIGHGQRLKPVPAIRRIELLITFRHEAQA